MISYLMDLLELCELRLTFTGAALLQNVVPLLIVISFQPPFWVTDDEINESEVFSLWGIMVGKVLLE
jgi:hypothetical protein